MQKYFFLIILFFISLNAFAQQAIVNENLLDISQRDKAPSSGIYQGVPFIKIEPTVGTQPREPDSGWMDSEKKRLFGTTQITKDSFFNQSISKAPAPIQVTPEIEYISPNGQALSDIYVPHTTDFIILIQVIDNQTLSVEEIIQTINPNRALFSRVLPINGGNFTPDMFKLIKAEKNGKPFSVNWHIADNQLTIAHPEYLDSGVQSFHLKYIIQSGISINKKMGIIDYPITGFSWPLPINRFTIFVSFPNKVTPQKTEILFGSNEASIKDSFVVKTDSNGNTLYRLNNPIPAFAGIKLHQSFKGEIISDSFLNRFFAKYISWISVLAVSMSIVLYLVASAFYLKKKKKDVEILKSIQKLTPLTLAYLYTGNISTDFINKLSLYYHMVSKGKKKNIYSYSALFNSSVLKQILYLILSVKLLSKYWLTIAFMIIGMYWITSKEGISLTFIHLISLFFVSILSIILFFKYAQKEFIKEIKQYRHKLVQKNTFCRLNEQTAFNFFLNHYPRMAAIGYETDWVDIAQQYAPQIKNLPFVQS